MMADRHWVGGTGSWTAANTANWSTSPGGAGGASVPTAADDVFISASSGGGTLTIATNVALAKSLDFTGFTGNLVLGQGFTLSGGLTLGASMGTITGGGYFYTFSATTDNGGAGWPINMNGKAFPSGSASTFAFSGVGGKWVLQGNANFGTSQINVSAGTFDTGNYSVTASGITSNSVLARTLTFGSSAITVTAQPNPWLFGGSVPTITTNTAVVTVTGNTNGVAMGNINYNGLSLVFNNQSTQAVVFTGHFAVRSITFTGSATKFGGASFAGNVVCTDSFVVNGNSAINRFLITSTQAGNAIYISTPSATLSNVDIMDVTMIDPTSPGTVVTSDSFNRPNSSLNGSTADAALGGSPVVWDTVSGSTAQIVSNRLTSSNAQQRGFLPVGTVDQIISIDVAVLPTVPSGIYGRVVDGNNFCYCVFAGANLYYGAFINGVDNFTQIAGASIVAGDTVTLGLIGNALYVKKNSTIVYSGVMPAAWPKGTKAGIQISSSTPNAEMDNFEVKTPTLFSGTSLGDCLGNGGIEFPAGDTQYYVTNASSNWSDVSKWASSSGGTGGTGRVPLPQDDVRFDANSVTAAGRLITIDMPRIGRNIDLTGAAVNNPTLSPALSTTTMYGDLTWASGVGAGQTSSPWIFGGRGTHTITMNGVIPLNWSMMVTAPGGSYSLNGALTIGGATPGTFSVTGGTFNTNNYTMLVGAFTSGGTITRVINLGTSTVTLVAAAGNWTISGSGLTMSAASATIAYRVSASARSFAGNGFTYGTLDYSVANSPGALGISGANTFGTVNIGPGRAFNLATAAIHTVGDFNPAGQNNGYLYMAGAGAAQVPDSAATSPTGTVTVACRVALDDWTPSAISYLATKWNSNNNRSFVFGVNTNGTLTLAVSNNGGGTTYTFNSTVTPAFTDGSTYWVAVTYTPSTGECKFWTASGASNAFPTGATWTQLGATVAAGGAIAIFDGTALFATGGSNDGGVSPPSGKFYRTILANNVLLDGTGIQCDMDFTTKAWGSNTFVESSSNAAAVTLTGNAIVGDGRVAISSASAGTSALLTLAGERQTFNYLVLRDVFSAIPYKFYAGTTSVNVSGNTNILFSTAPSAAAEPYVAFVAEAGGSGSSFTFTLPIPPGQAVLPNDVLIVLSRTGTTFSVASASGYTNVGKISDSTTVSGDILWKLAAGGETDVTVAYSTSNSIQAKFMVVRGLNGTPQVDVTDSTTAGGSSVTTLGTGAGVTNTADPAFAIASWMSNGTLGATVSVSDSFASVRSAATDQTAIRVAVKPLTSALLNKSTLVWTTAGTRSVGRMIVFKGSSTGNYRFLFVQY